MVILLRFFQAGLSLLPILLQSTRYIHQICAQAHESIDCAPVQTGYRVTPS